MALPPIARELVLLHDAHETRFESYAAAVANVASIGLPLDRAARLLMCESEPAVSEAERRLRRAVASFPGEVAFVVSYPVEPKPLCSLVDALVFGCGVRRVHVDAPGCVRAVTEALDDELPVVVYAEDATPAHAFVRDFHGALVRVFEIPHSDPRPNARVHGETAEDHRDRTSLGDPCEREGFETCVGCGAWTGDRQYCGGVRCAADSTARRALLDTRPVFHEDWRAVHDCWHLHAPWSEWDTHALLVLNEMDVPKMLSFGSPHENPHFARAAHRDEPHLPAMVDRAGMVVRTPADVAFELDSSALFAGAQLVAHLRRRFPDEILVCESGCCTNDLRAGGEAQPDCARLFRANTAPARAFASRVRRLFPVGTALELTDAPPFVVLARVVTSEEHCAWLTIVAINGEADLVRTYAVPERRLLWHDLHRLYLERKAVHVEPDVRLDAEAALLAPLPPSSPVPWSSQCALCGADTGDGASQTCGVCPRRHHFYG